MVWVDPSNDGADWEEMFTSFDDDPRDEKISFDEFKYLYDMYQCTDKPARDMFNELDANGDS